MKTAVIYARYSSDSQSEQSIEGQVRVCNDYAAKNDLVVVDTYIDRAMTGTNDNREAFQKMLKDSEKRQWSVLLIYKLDRFSRNQYETVIHKKTLKDNGVKIISVMENIPDTPEGILMESVLIGFNQYYSEELRQKVNRGLRESWLKGNATGGAHIFGYDIIDKKYVINEYERQIVVNVFEQYAKGFKAREIAEELNAQGSHRYDGKPFHEKYILYLLHNSRYTGKVTHNGETYDKVFPQIIDDELWHTVNEINEQNKITPSAKKAKFNYLLTGKLICGQCNHKMSGESGTSEYCGIYYYYVCPSHRHKTNTCPTKAISKDWLENKVITIIQQTLNSEQNLEFIADKVYSHLQKKCNDDTALKLLERQKKDVEKSIQNLLKAIEQGIISDITKNRLAELELTQTEINIKINQEKQKNYSFITKETIKDFLRSKLFDENLQDVKIRKALINSLIKEIRLYPDKIIIVFNIIERNTRDKLSVEDNINTATQINNALNNVDSSCLFSYTAPTTLFRKFYLELGDVMIYFLRHGQTDWNALSKCQGRADLTLNENGINQAQKIAEELSQKHIDKYFCSPLLRTRQTFEYAVGRKPLESEIDDRIIERDFGEFEGLTRSEFDFKDFWNNNSTQKFTKAESIFDVEIRAKQFLDDINKNYQDKNVLVVSHGGFGIVLMSLVNGKPKNGDYLQIEMPHGTLIEIDN